MHSRSEGRGWVTEDLTRDCPSQSCGYSTSLLTSPHTSPQYTLRTSIPLLTSSPWRSRQLQLLFLWSPLLTCSPLRYRQHTAPSLSSSAHLSLQNCLHHTSHVSMYFSFPFFTHPHVASKAAHSERFSC